MNARRTTLRLGLRALLAASLLLVAAVAVAATTTNAPGAYCVATNGNSLTIRTDGEAENKTAVTVNALCPVERVAGSTQVSGTVFVVDQSSSANVCCKLVSKNPSGARIDGTQACSTGSSTAGQSLSLAPITDAFSYSHFFVQCTMPPQNGASASRIQMYRTAQ
jgi:hypothetical protein